MSMRRAITFLLWTCLAAAPAALADDGERGKPREDECMKVDTEARYGAYGYDHIVHLENRCKTDMRCEVKTNANPKPTTVDVPRGEKRSVMTFRGSPAREFQADVDCNAPGEKRRADKDKDKDRGKGKGKKDEAR
jgi:hypothetical protein